MLRRKLIPVSETYDGDKFFVVKEGVKMATPLLLALAVIEISDVAFAVDSIPAVWPLASPGAQPDPCRTHWRQPALGLLRAPSALPSLWQDPAGLRERKNEGARHAWWSCMLADYMRPTRSCLSGDAWGQ